MRKMCSAIIGVKVSKIEARYYEALVLSTLLYKIKLTY